MNEPKFAEDILKIVYLWIGIAFIAIGLLCFIGALQPTSYSRIQESNGNGIDFLVLGTIFIILQFVQRAIVSRKKKLHNELLTKGTKVHGTVEKVCLKNSVRYAGKYPYVVFYTYDYQGQVYHGQSHLLWDIPDVKEQDSIVVYANDSGESTVQL